MNKVFSLAIFLVCSLLCTTALATTRAQVIAAKTNAEQGRTAAENAVDTTQTYVDYNDAMSNEADDWLQACIAEGATEEQMEYGLNLLQEGDDFRLSANGHITNAGMFATSGGTWFSYGEMHLIDGDRESDPFFKEYYYASALSEFNTAATRFDEGINHQSVVGQLTLACADLVNSTGCYSDAADFFEALYYSLL